MDRRLVVAGRNGLKDLPVALISALSGGLWAVAGIQYLWATHFPNFRVMDFVLYAWLGIIGYGWAGLVLYTLGIYSAAWLLRQFSPHHEPSFGPSFLAMSGASGLFVGCLLQWVWQQPTSLSVWNAWILGGIGSVVAMLIACQDKSFTVRGLQPKRRIGVPLLLLLSLLYLTNNGFPVVNTTAQAREQWGLRHFENYDSVVSNFQNCQPIVDRVGEVQFVAPTRGRNYHSSDGGSNHGHGELTLEIVGSRETGIANYSYQGSPSVTIHGPGSNAVSFTYRIKTEQLSCLNSVP